MLGDVSMCGPHSVQKFVFSKMCRRNLENEKKGRKEEKIGNKGISLNG